MFQLPQKIKLARIPTPIEPLTRLSREWGVDLRVKRDDLTGADLTGNKVRKLEYLLADALSKGCDWIVTCGAVGSNHARATALAARKLGLDSTLILAGERPGTAVGNLMLDLMAGAQVRYISWSDYTQNIENIFRQVEDELRRQGKKPYMIPSGGSCPIGLFGYIEAIQEISQQCEYLQWKPDIIACAVGSGGTYSGLLYGNALYSIASRIFGILVCNTVDYFTEKVLRDISGATKLLEDQSVISRGDVHLSAEYIAGGYAKTNSEQIRFIVHAAQTEALILDPVYTGKTLFGLSREIRKGSIAQGSRILFVHTGGIFGLSAFSDQFYQEWQSVGNWNVS